MANFKVIVQVYKEFRFDAANPEEAKQMAEKEMGKFPGEKYNINEPTNLDRKKEKRDAFKASKKAKGVVDERAKAPEVQVPSHGEVVKMEEPS